MRQKLGSRDRSVTSRLHFVYLVRSNADLSVVFPHRSLVGSAVGAFMDGHSSYLFCIFLLIPESRARGRDARVNLAQQASSNGSIDRGGILRSAHQHLSAANCRACETQRLRDHLSAQLSGPPLPTVE